LAGLGSSQVVELKVSVSIAMWMDVRRQFTPWQVASDTGSDKI
jgi:hypothetical protein